MEPTQVSKDFINDVEFHYFTLYPSEFVVNNANPVNGYISSDYKLVRKNLNNFKSGIEQSWPTAIIQDLIYVSLINLHITEDSDIVLLCPPASSKESNTDRFEKLSSSICNFINNQAFFYNKIKLHNAFTHIEIINEKSPKYTDEGELTKFSKTTWNLDKDLKFDSDFFNGKRVILLDDIVTTGQTMVDFIDKLNQLGAKPILCLSLFYTPKVFGFPLHVERKKVDKPIFLISADLDKMRKKQEPEQYAP